MFTLRRTQHRHDGREEIVRLEPPAQPVPEPVATIAVVRNGEPLRLLTIDPGSSLSKVRTALEGGGGLLPTDTFTDQDGFPIAPGEEADWTVAQLLGRSTKDDRTLHVRSTERKPKESVEVPSLPEVPKADISHREGERPPAAKEIGLPSGGKVEIGDEIADPVHLGSAQWADLIIRNHLCNGIRLDVPEPRPSFQRAFEVVGGIPAYVVWDESAVSAIATHTERETAYVKSKFGTVKGSASYAFAAASFEASHRERISRASGQQRTTVTGRWSYPRIIVRLAREDLVATPTLTSAVEAALVTGTVEDQFYALCQVFDRFGHVWATEVTLGGQLTLTDETDVASSAEEVEAETSMRTAVSVKVGLFKSDVSAGGTSGQTTSSALVEQFQQKSLTATGGDTRLVEDAGKWASTVGPVANWRVISRDRIMPLYEVLEDGLRDRVRKVLETVDPRFVPPIMDPEPPDPEPANVVTRAERDGLLVATCTVPGLVISALAGPGVDLAGPGVSAACADPGHTGVQTLTLPVRRGDSYLVEAVVPTGTAGTAQGCPVRFHQMVNIERAILGPPTHLRRSQDRAEVVPGGVTNLLSWQAPTCGFLIVWVHIGAAVPHLVYAIQTTGNVGILAQAGLDQPFPREVSMCLPVLATESYEITLEFPGPQPTSSDEPFADIWFVPIVETSARLDPPIQVADDVIYLAPSDGILISSRSDATVDIRVGDDRKTLLTADPVAASRSAGRGSYATITVPVRRGSYYCVTVAAGKDEGGSVARFFPLRRY